LPADHSVLAFAVSANYISLIPPLVTEADEVIE
jgi:hypothetical protein